MNNNRTFGAFIYAVSVIAIALLAVEYGTRGIDHLIKKHQENAKQQ